MAKNGSGEMPFLDHLEELRWRIVWVLGAAVVGMILGFFIVLKYKLILLLQQPIAPYLGGRKLMVTHPTDTMSITLTMAVTVGLIIASPVIIYQVWAFLSPALHRHEKKVVMPVIGGAVLLFVLGVSLAWFFVLPLCLRFLMTWQIESFDNMITASDYFGFVLTMALTFGATFELPMLILGLAALGLVTPKFLRKFRPYALALSFLVSAVVTPGDILIPTLALTAPLYLLYELSLILSSVIFRKREARAFAADHSATPDAA
jgi:sec-independent protein translocase protein TatC